MKTTIRLDTVTKSLQIEVRPHHGSIELDGMRIEGLTGRALRQIRNALISAIGFPEGQELDELDLDAEGLAEARDKITTYMGGSQQTTVFDDFGCPCISGFAPSGTKCSCGGTARTF